MLMHEVQQANSYIKENASPDAVIIAGAVVDAEERPEFQVTVIATGFPKVDASVYKNRTRAAAPQKQEARDKPAAPVASKTVAPGKTAAAEQPALVGATTQLDENGDLFSVNTGKGFPPPVIETRVEEPEDLSIPAFIRERKKKLRGR